MFNDIFCFSWKRTSLCATLSSRLYSAFCFEGMELSLGKGNDLGFSLSFARNICDSIRCAFCVSYMCDDFLTMCLSRNPNAFGLTLFSLSTSCHYVQHVCILFDTFSFVKAATCDTVLCSICWLSVSTRYLQYSSTDALVSNIMIADASHILESDSMFPWCASLLIVHSCFRDLHPFCKGTLMSISF